MRGAWLVEDHPFIHRGGEAWHVPVLTGDCDIVVVCVGPEDATCHKAENQLVMHVNPKGWDQR